MSVQENIDIKMLEELLKTVSDLLAALGQVQELAGKVKEELSAVVQSRVEEWRAIQAAKGLNPNDRALLWLKKKIAEIRGKHKDVKAEFILQNGSVTGLKYSAPDEESRADIESVTRWAFRVAAERPHNQEG
jgi:hypothetical protein